MIFMIEQDEQDNPVHHEKSCKSCPINLQPSSPRINLNFLIPTARAPAM
jgi:hypothetical protein